MAKYFTIAEMCASPTAARHGVKNTPNTLVTKRLNALMEQLDIIREAWGQPIVVNSGYRNSQTNALVGGVKNSNHLFGYAADIEAMDRKVSSNKKLFELIRKLQKEGKIKAFDELLNEYNFSWVHFAYRCDGTNRMKVLAIK